MTIMNKIYLFENLKKIKWGVLEENDPISLNPIMYPGWSYIVNKTGAILGRTQKSAACVHIGSRGAIFIDHNEWNELGVYTLDKILKNPAFGRAICDKILKLSDNLVDFTSKQIYAADLKKKSIKQLLTLYKKHERLHGDLYTYSIVPVYLELYKPHLTKYLVEFLHNQVNKINYHLSAKECFAHLTVPEKFSQVQLEEQSFLKIAAAILNNNPAVKIFSTEEKVGIAKLPSGLARSIKRHIAAYQYQGYNFEGPAFTEDYFIERWRELLKNKENPTKRLRQIILEKKRDLKFQNEIEKELKIDAKHQQLLDITRAIIYGKDYRKMSMVRSYFELEPLLKEIGRRLGLTLAQVRNCLILELEKMATGGSTPLNLSARMKGCLFVVREESLPGIVDTGDLFHKMKHHLFKQEDLSSVNYFHGQTAMTGQARGTVKIINNKEDLKKMNVGDVLVSKMTNPDLVPAMKKAAAIITDMGGVTCHAAIVSRELKIPCVIGTKVATKVLKDGETVFVDGNTGEIRKI